MDDICLAVSTFKKNSALRGWLDSTVHFGRVSVVHIADDDNGNAEEVAQEYSQKHASGTYPFPIFYSTGPNKGIAINKNRSIRFFLEEPEASGCSYLVLSDDDIVFKQSTYGEKHIGDRFVKASHNASIRHITGYLGSAHDPLSGNPFFTQFPPIAEDEYLYHCSGTQGILLFFHRELVKGLGYFDTNWKSKYGYEHAAYSARANRFEGRAPELYPILKDCNLYFGCQGIPNNYSADPGPNASIYQKRLAQVYQGVDLTVRRPE